MKKDLEIADPKSCLNKAADDEPIFVLRGKDPLAAQTVRYWAGLAAAGRVHEPAKIAEAREFSFEMEDYAHRVQRG